MAAKFIFGSQKISGTIKTLSQSTKGITSGLLSDPERIENIISLVRTAAPLTSEKTVAKINTYLPPFELISTLLGMYAFLNKTQNYSPIKSLNAHTPLEKVSALISNGNLPIGKIIAQPIIANNMDKIISSLAKGFIGNNNINDLISSMLVQNSNIQPNLSNSGDLSSLMETFMPLISNMMSDSSSNSNSEHHKNMEYPENTEEISDKATETHNIYLNETNDNTMTEEQNSNNNEYKSRNENNHPKNTPIRIRQRRKNSQYNKRMI